jgi:anaerobic selenocysteine-containing dehydrogenase
MKSSGAWRHAWVSTTPCFRDTDDDMIRTVLASGHPFLEGITLEKLEAEHSVRLRLPNPFRPFAEGGFGTPSGKCEFRAETLDFEPPVESRAGDRKLTARFPLELISPKNDDSMNSTFGNRPDTDANTAVLTIHPEEAKPRGIATGDAVLVFNDVKRNGRRVRNEARRQACADRSSRLHRTRNPRP